MNHCPRCLRPLPIDYETGTVLVGLVLEYYAIKTCGLCKKEVSEQIGWINVLEVIE